jgi:hypothetical protein
MYLPDDTGVYTDTAEFVDIIPECTNISCGYNYEHSDREELDIVHLVTLANAVCNMDWDALPTDRDPTVKEQKSFGGWGATSVPSSFGEDDGHWYFDDDKQDWDKQILRDAIYDAMVGIPQDLIDLMCDSVYPEDPRMAKQFISAKKLTDELLDELLLQANVYDTDTVLCTLFDNLYVGG